jgi:hypothetical protein
MKYVQIFFALIIALACVLIFLDDAKAESIDVEFHWFYDNADFATIDGFRLYMREPGETEYPENPSFWVTVEDACVDGPMSCCMVNAIDGNHYFILRAYRDDTESIDSNEVLFDPTIPSAPFGLLYLIPAE